MRTNFLLKRNSSFLNSLIEVENRPKQTNEQTNKQNNEQKNYGTFKTINNFTDSNNKKCSI